MIIWFEILWSFAPNRYFISFLLDSTIGLLVIYLGLKTSQFLCMTPNLFQLPLWGLYTHNEVIQVWLDLLIFCWIEDLAAAPLMSNYIYVDDHIEETMGWSQNCHNINSTAQFHATLASKLKIYVSFGPYKSIAFSIIFLLVMLFVACTHKPNFKIMSHPKLSILKML